MSTNMYLQTITQISDLICEAELDNLQTIRTLLSDVMITNTPSAQIIKDMMFEICESPLVQNENKYKIIEIAAQYEHIVARRIRHIVFLMGFVVTTMKIISDNMNTSTTLDETSLSLKRKNENDGESIESGKRKCIQKQADHMTHITKFDVDCECMYESDHCLGLGYNDQTKKEEKEEYEVEDDEDDIDFESKSYRGCLI